jgi:hypothetical protein
VRLPGAGGAGEEQVPAVGGVEPLLDALRLLLGPQGVPRRGPVDRWQAAAEHARAQLGQLLRGAHVDVGHHAPFAVVPNSVAPGMPKSASQA